MPAIAARKKTFAQSPNTDGIPAAPAEADVRDAIRRRFFFDGLMVMRHLYDADGVGRYRVNWFRDGEFGSYIHESRFLLVERKDGAVDVRDTTAA
jgi:hypothetical protein